MEDVVIQDSTPKGSALLAYGEAPRRFPFVLGILVAFAVALVVILASFGTVFLTQSIPVPVDPIVLLYVQPNAALPYWTPEMWRDAQRQAKPFPIFVGFTRDTTGDTHPFAITLRTFRSEDARTSWVWQLIQPIQNKTTLATPHELTGSWLAFIQPAWLRIWPDRLFNTNASATDDIALSGPVSAHQWKTDLAFAATPAGEPRGANYLDLNALPTAWPYFETALREQGLDLNLDAAPIAFSWIQDDAGNLTVAASFADELTTSTKAQLAGSVGVTDKTTYTLPDNTVVNELTLPYSTLQTSSGTEIALEDGRKLLFEGKDVIVGDPALLVETPHLPEACKGRILAAFDSKSINQALPTLGISSSSLSPMSLFFVEANGKLNACW